MEDTLSEIFTQCWGKLMYGSFIGGSPFHTGIVGTQKGNAVSLRTVVLRFTDPDEKQVVFYTDSRSAKVAELKNNSQLSWLFYDQGESIQVKISGGAIIHHLDDTTQQHWEKVHADGRRSYMAIPGPSTGVTDPADGLEYLNGDNKDTEDGYDNFAVVVTQVNFIEWLSLKDSGHRRAQFKWVAESWKGQWLIP